MKKYLIALALLFLSCAKQEGGRESETFDQHPLWPDRDSNDFWNKRAGMGVDVPDIAK